MSSFSIALPSVKIGVTVTTESTEFSESPRSPKESNACATATLDANEVAVRLNQAVVSAKTFEELSVILSPSNTQYNSIVSESAYQRVWNLIDRKNLINTHRSVFWSEEKVFIPFFTPESVEQADFLRKSKMDYLENDSLFELKKRCSYVLLDEISEKKSLEPEYTIESQTSVGDSSFNPELPLYRRSFKRRIESTQNYQQLQLVIVRFLAEAEGRLPGVLSDRPDHLRGILPGGTLRRLYDRFHPDGFIHQRHHLDPGLVEFFKDHGIKGLLEEFPSSKGGGFPTLRERCAKLFA
jgi:hypothetical protein